MYHPVTNDWNFQSNLLKCFYALLTDVILLIFSFNDVSSSVIFASSWKNEKKYVNKIAMKTGSLPRGFSPTPLL